MPHYLPAGFITTFSTLSRLQRVTAYCFRFFHNATNPLLRRTGYLTSIELKDVNCQLQPLYPFIDKESYLRVGGRLQHSHLPYESKHQLILPPMHHITKLTIMHEHFGLLHSDPPLLIASLRQQYWIMRMKQVIRPVLHHYLPCFNLQSIATRQLTGQLPLARVTASRPFVNSGVDYVGPFEIKSGTTRSKTTTECYVALFICMST